MKRLGFAFWLPLLHCVLYLSLVSTSRQAGTLLTPSAGEPSRLTRLIALPQDAVLPPFGPAQPSAGRLPDLAKLAFAINLPATAAVAFLLWLLPVLALDQPALFSTIGCLVPVLWWLVGMWVDGELGIRPRRVPREGRFWNAFRQFFLGGSVFGTVGCLLMLAMLLLNQRFRAEWDAGTSRAALLALMAGLVLWPSFLLSVAWKLIYRARAYRIAFLLARMEQDAGTPAERHVPPEG